MVAIVTHYQKNKLKAWQPSWASFYSVIPYKLHKLCSMSRYTYKVINQFVSKSMLVF